MRFNALILTRTLLDLSLNFACIQFCLRLGLSCSKFRIAAKQLQRRFAELLRLLETTVLQRKAIFAPAANGWDADWRMLFYCDASRRLIDAKSL
jgi:hypothetical protein